MRYIDVFIGILFLTFGIVQYNDPDFYIWIPVYGIVAFIAFSNAFKKPQQKLALVASVLLAIWMITYIPDLISWIQEGTPNIAGSMKAESPHIELIRELFGIVISLVATGYYSFANRG